MGLLGRIGELFKEVQDIEKVSAITVEIEKMTDEYNTTQQRVYETLEMKKSTSSLKTNDENSGANLLEKDLWRQMKRVGIPVFHGDKWKYESWNAAFTACIDKAPATKEYKLLHLRQYVQVDALRAIDDLGHSTFHTMQLDIG